MEFRQHPAEIQVSMSTACEGSLGATGPTTDERPSEIAATVSTYISGNQESNPTTTFHTASYHTKSYFSHLSRHRKFRKISAALYVSQHEDG